MAAHCTLYRILADYIAFDYSCPDTDISCPGGVGGCLWTKPFCGQGITHVPTTLPFEMPLFFGQGPQQLVDFWRPKNAWLSACGGHVVVNTHPDPHYSGNDRMLEAYAKLLAVLTRLPDLRGQSSPSASTRPHVADGRPGAFAHSTPA